MQGSSPIDVPEIDASTRMRRLELIETRTGRTPQSNTASSPFQRQACAKGDLIARHDSVRPDVVHRHDAPRIPVGVIWDDLDLG